jgi:hypothetical protein
MEIQPMAHQMNYAEHRWGARIQVRVPLRVASPTETAIDGRMTNLSLSGALLSTSLAAPLNTRIAVTLALPSPLQGDAVIEAHVTRRVNGAVGVEWCQFAPAAVKDLLRSPSVRLPV